MKVLFIGNSYTFYNDMPGIFRSICEANGVKAEVLSVTCGGYTIAHYVSDDNEYGRRAKELLRDQKFDYVVLQEQSVRPAKNPETFYKSVREFIPYIIKNGARPVLYQTWGRPDGTQVLTDNSWTHEEMQDLLKKAYVTAANENNAILVPAGDRLHEAYRAGVDVYCDDGGHPSPEGSRIIAQAFYDTLVADRR
ncbi:MAG: SGNH/GDSL hydrolase family protein [Clostridia bacterium]|nr:SGNH/GDSL hydrolase family protein [Clostridia bacterium]